MLTRKETPMKKSLLLSILIAALISACSKETATTLPAPATPPSLAAPTTTPVAPSPENAPVAAPAASADKPAN